MAPPKPASFQGDRSLNPTWSDRSGSRWKFAQGQGAGPGGKTRGAKDPSYVPHGFSGSGTSSPIFFSPPETPACVGGFPHPPQASLMSSERPYPVDDHMIRLARRAPIVKRERYAGAEKASLVTFENGETCVFDDALLDAAGVAA